TYVHTPFNEIAHADRPKRAFADAWESHFNLGVGEIASDGDNREVINFVYNSRELNRLFGVSDDDMTRTFDMTIPEFRRKYYFNKSARRNPVLTVGVHVRRGDVNSSRPDMWTNTSSIAKTIANVREVLNAHCIKYRIYIFSQGEYADLAELDAPGTELFL